MAEAGSRRLRPDRPRHAARDCPRRGPRRRATASSSSPAPRSRPSGAARTTSTSWRSSWTRTTRASTPRSPGARRSGARGASGWPRSSSSTATPSISTRSAPTSATASGGGRTWRARSSARATRRTTTTPSTGSSAGSIRGTCPTRSGRPSRSSARSATAGGVSSLAHAVWYKDADALIRALAAEGLDAIEVFHPDHGPDEERRFRSLARELGLATTAGSDFHGTPEGRKRPGARRRATRACSTRFATRKPAKTSCTRLASARSVASALERRARSDVICPADRRLMVVVENVGGLSKNLLMTLRRNGGTLARNSTMLDEITADKIAAREPGSRALRARSRPARLRRRSTSSSRSSTPDDFFPDNHRRIYAAMRELSERATEIDVLTLKEELDRAGAIEKVGGAAYLSALLDGVPDVGNVEHYARIVKEKSTLRRLIRAGQRIVRDGLAGETGRGGAARRGHGRDLRHRRGLDPGRLRADRRRRRPQPRDHRGRPRPAGDALGPRDGFHGVRPDDLRAAGHGPHRPRRPARRSARRPSR